MSTRVTDSLRPTQLPLRKRWIALADVIDSQRPPIASEEDLELLLSGLRAVGRARVGYTQQPANDVLEAVLTGLRRL